ncbi:hypothetical protein [Thalassomonas haliotis]|nr:hypothetical protein [Thalassomonas haliotis]
MALAIPDEFTGKSNNETNGEKLRNFFQQIFQRIRPGTLSPK